MSWRHTVLELYPKPLSGEFPTEGDPVDWIEEETVLWCQGDDSTVIYFAPLWWILWIKVTKYVDAVRSAWINHVWSKTPWWKRRAAEFWAEREENTISTEELKELMGEEDYAAMKEFIGDSDDTGPGSESG